MGNRLSPAGEVLQGQVYGKSDIFSPLDLFKLTNGICRLDA